MEISERNTLDRSILLRTFDRLRVLYTQTWFQKSSVAVVDQAVFAGANFALNIMLARWLSEVEYGAFVIAYAIFLLALNFYDSLLIEPFSVFGSGKYAKSFRRYYGYVFYGHSLITLIISCILAVVGFTFQASGQTHIAQSLWGLAVVSTFLLARLVTRQSHYIQTHPKWALTGNFIYLISIVVGLGALQFFNRLSIVSALLIMGASSILSSGYLLYLLSPNWTKDDNQTISNKTVLIDHWHYGRWSTSSRFLRWLQTNIFYFVLPALIGIAASGTLKALMNLSMPITQAGFAMGAVLTPEFVRILHRSGKPKLNNFLVKIVAIGTFLSAIYIIVLVIIGPWLVNLLYDGKYGDETSPLVFLSLGFLPYLTALNVIFTSSLGAMEHVRYYFAARLAGTIFILTGGMALAFAESILGALLGWIGASIISLVVLIWFYIILEPNISRISDTNEAKSPTVTQS